MAKSAFLSSGFLTIAFVSLLIVFIIHVTGFTLPIWTTVNLNVMISEYSLQSEYHIGLWQDSFCIHVYGKLACSTVPKHESTGIIKAVQILETFALTGLLVSVVLSFILIFIRQTGTLKLLNIAFVCSSGIFIIIGVIVYGLFCNGDTEETMSYVTSVLNTLNVSSNSMKLGTSFILSTIAGSLCLFLCTFLFIIEFRRNEVEAA
ncbi:uncharacterized protein LOC132754412 [Ruditapes philippinarum]|uniref:uncharacterized protein LOC132754412 n=1 Tax=Ruditapes philippinarum TaxID=129788 RepID=UPI00295B884F|nr:uncharacterized protein LOC132754412 [Ruditapes philippinarum]